MAGVQNAKLRSPSQTGFHFLLLPRRVQGSPTPSPLLLTFTTHSPSASLPGNIRERVQASLAM